MTSTPAQHLEAFGIHADLLEPAERERRRRQVDKSHVRTQRQRRKVEQSHRIEELRRALADVPDERGYGWTPIHDELAAAAAAHSYPLLGLVAAAISRHARWFAPNGAPRIDPEKPWKVMQEVGDEVGLRRTQIYAYFRVLLLIGWMDRQPVPGAPCRGPGTLKTWTLRKWLAPHRKSIEAAQRTARRDRTAEEAEVAQADAAERREKKKRVRPGPAVNLRPSAPPSDGAPLSPTVDAYVRRGLAATTTPDDAPAADHHASTSTRAGPDT